jgi:hypothetical protein
MLEVCQVGCSTRANPLRTRRCEKRLRRRACGPSSDRCSAFGTGTASVREPPLPHPRRVRGRERFPHTSSVLPLVHAAWGKSDLYYVARLEPSSDAEVILCDPEEISDCCWMDVDEFLATQDRACLPRRRPCCPGGEHDAGRARSERVCVRLSGWLWQTR